MSRRSIGPASIRSTRARRRPPARSGLSRLQALRYVILPQAVRRVIPPLLNDFIGLQKDTVLVSFIGVVEIFRDGPDHAGRLLQLHAVHGRRPGLPRRHDPAARLTDWLVARDRRRAAAGGLR